MNYPYRCECGEKFTYYTEDPETKCPNCRNQKLVDDGNYDKAIRTIQLLYLVSEELNRVFDTKLNVEKLKHRNKVFDSLEQAEKSLRDYIDLCRIDLCRPTSERNL